MNELFIVLHNCSIAPEVKSRLTSELLAHYQPPFNFVSPINATPRTTTEGRSHRSTAGLARPERTSQPRWDRHPRRRNTAKERKTHQELLLLLPVRSAPPLQNRRYPPERPPAFAAATNTTATTTTTAAAAAAAAAAASDIFHQLLLLPPQ
jgi:hypothetical protein